MRIVLFVGLALLSASRDVHAQNAAATDSADIHYYDNWPGAWHRIEGAQVDSLPTFVIRRGPGHSFAEDWYLVIDGKRTHSFGLRSWDPQTRAWRLVWVADPDLFQIWDGLKVDRGWYIIRQFGEGKDAFLSRQAWIMEAPDRALRTVERSTDGGKTWTVRYRNQYIRR